jgi:enterochelin esterase-like enzyme
MKHHEIRVAVAIWAGVFLSVSAYGQPAPARKRTPATETAGPPEWVRPPVEAVHTTYHTFPSKLAGGPVSYLIYLPAGYEKTNRRYPVVYWLHGRGGSQQGIPGFAERLTKAIESGQAPAMIVVFVNGLPTGGYRDSADGKQPVESIAIQELIPHIDSAYRTVANREGRLIEGFSMGGSGAAKWGFKFSGTFGSISIFAGALHGRGSPSPIPPGLQLEAKDDPWALAEENAARVRGRTVVRVTVGAKDGLARANTAFHELLARLKIDHQFAVIDDVAHTPWPLYDALGEKGWAFYYQAFRLKPGASQQ